MSNLTMTEQEKQLYQTLCWGPPRKYKLMSNEGGVSQFVKEFRPHLSDSQRVQEVLEEAIRSHDAREVQIAISVVLCIGCSAEHFSLLEELFREEWHCSHEDIVMNSEDFESEKAIEALGWAAQVRLKSLEANDSEALARKAIYALAKIPGERACKKLQWIAQHSGGQRRKWALQKIKTQKIL